ncbi:hypothetical protein [Paraburkholderia flagellata]|nr:hypothetical protein [Paraburkholderia flagellata]
MKHIDGRSPLEWNWQCHCQLVRRERADEVLAAKQKSPQICGLF